MAFSFPFCLFLSSACSMAPFHKASGFSMPFFDRIPQVFDSVSSSSSVQRSSKSTPLTSTSSLSRLSPGPLTSYPPTTTKNAAAGGATPFKPATVPKTATLLVGPKQRKFKVNKHLLCSASPMFKQLLNNSKKGNTKSILWLPGESASMFALFVEWLHARHSFRWHLDDTIATAVETSPKALRDVHWAIIKLHLFASNLSLHHLQDLAMDGIQDLYLKCDWDVPPGLVEFIYTKCEPLPAVRLRRWAVAMVAFSLTGGSQMTFHPQNAQTSDPSKFHALLNTIPEFAADYTVHLSKMRDSGLDVRLKNPQLRILANKLKNEERAFGFRECSFHSHRSTIGERRCPHDSARFDIKLEESVVVDVGLDAGIMGLTSPSRRPSQRDKEREAENESVPGQKTMARKSRVKTREGKMSRLRGQNEDTQAGAEAGAGIHASVCEDSDSRSATKKYRDTEGPSKPGLAEMHVVTCPLFSRGVERERSEEEQALGHMPSISSVLSKR